MVKLCKDTLRLPGLNNGGSEVAMEEQELTEMFALTSPGAAMYRAL